MGEHKTEGGQIVWLAINLYPESMEVLVATTREGAVTAIRDTINPDEWEQFQDGIRRNGEPGADLTLAGDVDAVVQHYWGEYQTAEDEGAEAVFVGEEWLVRPAVVSTPERDGAR